MSIIGNCLNITITECTYYAIDSFVAAVKEDPRFRKVVLSTGIIYSGLKILKVSQIPKILHSWIWEKQSALPQESGSKLAMRWSAAAIGCLAVCYGTYTIIKELTIPEMEETPLEVLHFIQRRPTCQISYLAEQTNRKTAQPKCPPCDEAVALSIEYLRACPDFNDLWLKVEKEGPFSIKCVPDKLVTGIQTQMKQRVIFVSEHFQSIPHGILFELNNLNQAKRYSKMLASACRTPVNDFAYKSEMLECKTERKKHEILNACIPQFWPIQHSDPLTHPFCTKSPNCKDSLVLVEKNFHTDNIRYKWYQTCDPRGLSHWLITNKSKWKDAAMDEKQMGHLIAKTLYAASERALANKKK